MFAWPNAKVSVMGGKQAAGVLHTVKQDQLKHAHSAVRIRWPTDGHNRVSGTQSQLRKFSGEENIQHFDGVRGDRRKPSHLQLHYGAQGGPRDLGQPRQAKGAWWKAPGVVCGCRFAVRTGGRGPDLAAHLQSQAYRKLRCLLRVPV